MNYLGYEFNEDQWVEIQLGIEEWLDVSKYANPEFLAIQMQQIRLGLKDRLDVSAYNTTEYDWFQMEEIRLGMKARVDYRTYAKPSIDYRRMRELRKGLEKGIDMSMFVQLDAGVLRELRKAILAKVSIVDYIKQGYHVEQLEQIRLALEAGVDIKPYITTEMTGDSIGEIRLGLEAKLDVSGYADIEYHWQQMREIRLGLMKNLPVEEYSNTLFSWKQMRELRLGLEAGLDISSYKKFIYTASDMEVIRSRMLMDNAEQIVNSKAQELGDDVIKVYISNDEMEACLEINAEPSFQITADRIVSSLKQQGVCQGFLMKEIEALAKEKKYKQTVVVAKGKHAKKGEDGRYEFFFNTNPTKRPKIKEDGSVDFREIEWYEIAEEGQKIACYHPAKFGTPGYTVTGKFLAGKKGIDKGNLSGKNFSLLPDKKTYVASITGKIDLIEGNRVEISRVCVYDDVNLATGNINFDGSVYIRGNVSKGVIICATENIVIAGYVEGAIIKCGGDICFKQGVNGAGIGLIEAGGNVMGQFFESVHVLAAGNVDAYYCLNCEIWSQGAVTILGKKGMIAGGFIRGARGITAYTVGNKAKISTVLNAGVDNKFLNEVWQMDGKIESVNKELAILGNSYVEFQRKYPAEVRNTMQLYIKIEDAIYTKELQLKGLMQQKQTLEESMQEMLGAKVIVGGVLYEGTEVIIDNLKWKSFDVQDVTIRCHNRKLVVESNE